MQKKKIIWCVHHNPVELLIRVAKDFSNILSKYTDEYEIEILTSQEYADYYGNGNVSIDTIDMVNQGLVQISQSFAWDLSYINSSFQALDMPYLFKNHDHARRVLDGQIGNSLLNSLSNRNVDIKGLAFTYSGGYRIFCSNHPLDSLASLKGKNVLASLSSVQTDTLAEFGAYGKDVDSWTKRQNWMTRKEDLVMQTTWVRYNDWMPEYAPYVLDAQHSLFLTCLIINKEFWNSLSSEHQEIFQKAANEAAANEKDLTVRESEKFRNGQSVITKQLVLLTEEELEKARAMVQPVYDKWKDSFMPKLIDKIEAA